MSTRIGISACFFHADPKRPIFKGKTLQYLEQSLAHWVMREGALAYMIPAPPKSGGPSLAEYAREMDGLILHGGSDVAPQSYGEEALKPEWGGDFIRDQYETALLREFVALKKPVLGVCRGAQLLNVAYGGTLYQDIATQYEGTLNHRNWDIYDQNIHEIEFVADSRLARVYGETGPVRTNHIHHQAVRKLGKGIVVEATSPKDGVIEAIRLESPGYVLAVQWHPEFHDPADDTLLDSGPLIRDFLKEAKKHA